MGTKILSNQVRCPECGESIYSAHRHDFNYCPCGQTMVDGGMSYLRRSVGAIDESIVVSEEDCEGLMNAIDDPSKNTLGKLCNVVRYLRDQMGVNVGLGGQGNE